ncbi:MAG: ABC-F family ATP-binding cassette domain-containing protein [Acidobacteriota bacterium]
MWFRFENVAKEFGGTPLFRAVSVQANPGDRVGLIGRNGCGKTTFLDLIEGRTEPDGGQIHRNRSLKLARIEQMPTLEPDTSIRQAALQVFRDLKQMEQQLRQLEVEMSGLHGKVPEGTASEYESLRLQLELKGGYDYEARTEAALLGVGFEKGDLDQLCTAFSGGQVSRLLLARALLRPSNLLLLDEPTNHLDLEGTLWLIRFLRQREGAFVLISHDRHLLDSVTEITWEIEGGRLETYPGGFSRARRLREERHRLQAARYQRQQQWKKRTEEYIRRNIAGQKTRQAQSRRKHLEKTEWLQGPPRGDEKPTLRVEEARRGGAVSFRLLGATIGYRGRPLLPSLDLIVHRGDRIAILGGNGTGKSTLLKTLVGEIPLLDGRLEWGANTAPSYFSQDPWVGEGSATVYDSLRRLDLETTDFELRAFAARFLFRGEEIFKRIEQLSGGERTRLALARVLYHPTNVLILDEPTNHLDLSSQEALEAALADYSGTLMIVSHDLYFVDRMADRLYLIRDRTWTALENLQQLTLEEGEGRRTKPATRGRKPTRSSVRVPSAMSKHKRRRREQQLAQLEARIEDLERRRSKTLEALQRKSDFTRLHHLATSHEELEGELARLYEEWESAAAELMGTSG